MDADYTQKAAFEAAVAPGLGLGQATLLLEHIAPAGAIKRTFEITGGAADIEAVRTLDVDVLFGTFRITGIVGAKNSPSRRCSGSANR